MEQKTIDLFTGSEEGANWSMRLKIGKKGQIGETYFWSAGGYKIRIRSGDRAFFKKYGGTLLKKYELHHDWGNGGVCFLLSHAEHLKRR